MYRRFQDRQLPDWLRPEFVSNVTEAAMDQYFARFPRNRCDVMSEEWDTLLILDGCRFDYFREQCNLDGALGSRLSQGSNTAEFFEGNFADEQYQDTVYVTANPVPRVEKWCSVDIDTVFHAVVDVWEDHWNHDINTVRPEPVAAAIEQAHREYPEKRIIGHFIQPHQPFIGETGQQLDELGMRAVSELSEAGSTESGSKVWEQLENGELSCERVKQAYAENLELVLPNVREVIESISGKVVVTADHGNMFGGFAWPFPVRTFGHPPGVHARKLIKVPWLELPCDSRRKIVSDIPGEPTGASTGTEERLRRLEDLGYR